jgi:hypothetical protein
MRPMPPGWGPSPRPGWGYFPVPPGRCRPELGGVTALVLLTVLTLLAAPHAHQLRGVVAAGAVPAIRLPKLPRPSAAPDRRPSTRAGRAVACCSRQPSRRRSSFHTCPR